MLVVELGGPTMMCKLGGMRALNRRHVRGFTESGDTAATTRRIPVMSSSPAGCAVSSVCVPIKDTESLVPCPAGKENEAGVSAAAANMAERR